MALLWMEGIVNKQGETGAVPVSTMESFQLINSKTNLTVKELKHVNFKLYCKLTNCIII